MSLLARFFKTKYFPNHTFLETNSAKKSLFVWKGNLLGKKLLDKGSGWRIGNGQSVNIQHSNWLPSQTFFSTEYCICTPFHYLPNEMYQRALGMGFAQTPTLFFLPQIWIKLHLHLFHNLFPLISLLGFIILMAYLISREDTILLKNSHKVLSPSLNLPVLQWIRCHLFERPCGQTHCFLCLLFGHGSPWTDFQQITSFKKKNSSDQISSYTSCMNLIVQRRSGNWLKSNRIACFILILFVIFGFTYFKIRALIFLLLTSLYIGFYGNP